MRARPSVRRCACGWWLVAAGPLAPGAHYPEFATWAEALEHALTTGSEATA